MRRQLKFCHPRLMDISRESCTQIPHERRSKEMNASPVKTNEEAVNKAQIF